MTPQDTPEKSIPLKIIPLGGLGEIGLNMTVFEYDGVILVVDSGLMFPEDYMLGVDIVIPDYEYLRENKERVAGIVLTHCHEDHIGALPFLLKDIPAPVYATPFTIALVSHKLEEKDLLSRVDLHKIKPRESFSIGPFHIEFVRASHSVVDGVSLAIRTPAGLIVHTGDFKITHGQLDDEATDVSRLAQLGEEGVLALLSDSTNAEKEGYTLSESEIGATLEKAVRDSSGRVIVALFASNVPRLAQIVNIAAKTGKKIVFNGRSIEVSMRIAQELGYINVPPGMQIDVSEVKNYEDNEVLLVTTGSQGEPMSALARVAAGAHKQIKIRDGDTVILSSKFIPGNEKAITGIINNLYRRGAEVIYEKISAIHVSGHAFREELKLMMHLTRPRYFMPVHGEYRHLLHHARLAEKVGIPKNRILLAQNGNVINFMDEVGWIGESVDTGRTFVDGKGIGDVGRKVLKDRRALSEHGMVVATMVLDFDTGVVIYGPELLSRGFVFEDEKGHLLQDAQCVIMDAVEQLDLSGPDRIPLIEAATQQALRRFFNYVIRRRPVIVPLVLEV
ncbi:beta-lactamase domain protein [Desulfatibacillum aliphaticivorans]|uniref:Ribonuclease J n=1 Tax=Desulfatibacillum aliphaticivorans TaxID=218208 RepID=B8FN86_DESAL|nr:ribonuclease J [Desulfatibacillum aliphaticivorans]ACL06055.1 beta-lactamase domain protein [Desulfatibacillum aliphaticivorans]